jgi:hypothetical protein
VIVTVSLPSPFTRQFFGTPPGKYKTTLVLFEFTASSMELRREFAGANPVTAPPKITIVIATSHGRKRAI